MPVVEVFYCETLVLTFRTLLLAIKGTIYENLSKIIKGIRLLLLSSLVRVKI